MGAAPVRLARDQGPKVFCFFFSKKKSFLLLSAFILPLGAPDKTKYAVFDPATHHLFIAHGAEITVVDTESMTIAGHIGGLPGAHGVALAPGGKAYAASGKAASVAVFDTTTLKSAAVMKAGEDANAVVYDPASRHIFVMNDDAATITIIDPARDAAIATITLPPGEGLEGAAADGAGHLFVNHSAAADVLRIDTRASRVDAAFKIADCRKPQGMALDPLLPRAFITCENGRLLVIDRNTGRQVAALPIGPGRSSVFFDASRRRIVVPSAESTISVIDAATAGSFTVRPALAAEPGVRAAAFDEQSGRLYLVRSVAGALSLAMVDLSP